MGFIPILLLRKHAPEKGESQPGFQSQRGAWPPVPGLALNHRRTLEQCLRSVCGACSHRGIEIHRKDLDLSLPSATAAYGTKKSRQLQAYIFCSETRSK